MSEQLTSGKAPHFSALTLRAEVEKLPLKAPFRIAGYTFETVDVLVVTLEKDGKAGRGEASGIYYKNDKPVEMVEKIRALKSAIEAGLNRDSIQTVLPPGGARNALDCAMWDLEAKLTGRPAWQIAGLDQPKPLLTTFTCGAEAPDTVVATARDYANAHTGAKAIKLKLNGDGSDADRVRAVREALPQMWLGVDANQAFTRPTLEQLMPVFVDAKVSLIEQPFPIGQEAWLDGFKSPIRLAADESAQNLQDVAGLVGRFNVMNIKLDKCGGLTEGLAMARKARALGLEVMVGNMIGSSLAMAPSFLVGQLCSVVDLDGPVFLKADRAKAIQYAEGRISSPDNVWGSAT